MSDRFKFRVWDNANGVYDTDGFLLDGRSGALSANGGDFTIEQCTGVRDKNGRLIYDGDVVEVKPWRGQIGHMNHRWYAFDDCCAVELPTIDANKIEVVGNIHEVKK